MDRRLFVLIALAAVIVGFSLADPRFLGARSLDSIFLWIPLLLVVALGQFFVVLSGGIDISVGSILGFSAIATGIAFRSIPNLHPAAGFLIATVCGLLLGILNGSLIAYAKIGPLIATIGTMVAFRGAAFLLSKGEQIDSSSVPQSMTRLASEGILFGGATFNGLLIISLTTLAIASFAMRFYVPCRLVAAVGSNRVAANLKGINVKSTEFWVYVVCGALAGFAGAMYISRFGFVNPSSAGQNLELSVIAAVAIGGTKLTGGAGSVSGVFLGCVLLACINVGLSVLGIDANWQLLAYGVVILAAIVADGLANIRRSE